MNTTVRPTTDEPAPAKAATPITTDNRPDEPVRTPDDAEPGEWMVNLATGRIYWRPRK